MPILYVIDVYEVDSWNELLEGPWSTAEQARYWATSDDGGFHPEDENVEHRPRNLGWRARVVDR